MNSAQYYQTTKMNYQYLLTSKIINHKNIVMTINVKLY